MYTLGFDIGSSAVKAVLMNCEIGTIAGSATSPEREMEINALNPGWAEQLPEDWWTNIREASRKLLEQNPAAMKAVKAVGITYQMHGLVLVDENKNVLRPSIIWCDSRAAEIGHKAAEQLGERYCLSEFLNSPGNFTASKLRWVQANEPDTFEMVFRVMLPGDYVAMKMTGDITTTKTGLSEGILWNFRKNSLATELLDHWNIPQGLIPEVVPEFGRQGTVSNQASSQLGIPENIPVSYRAGDQPNNAFSLNVLHPGEVAATAGTSGVVYGVMDKPAYDPHSRVNTFVHVNHTTTRNRLGVLLCVNGTGILNSWIRKNMFPDLDFPEMNKLASEVGPGADGIMVFPYGNGSERSLMNREPGVSFHGLSLNRHDRRHLLRAAQEGIVFALAYGMEIMNDMGVKTENIKAGHANMFLSPVFRDAFVQTTGATLSLYKTNGAEGAARGAAVGAGIHAGFEEAFEHLQLLKEESPISDRREAYLKSYNRWKEKLSTIIS